MTLEGNHGHGYASAAALSTQKWPLVVSGTSEVLQLDPAAPYKRAKIRIIAADKADVQCLLLCLLCHGSVCRSLEVTVKHYTLVVALTNHRAWAMLEDLAACSEREPEPFLLCLFPRRKVAGSCRLALC